MTFEGAKLAGVNQGKRVNLIPIVQLYKRF